MKPHSRKPMDKWGTGGTVGRMPIRQAVRCHCLECNGEKVVRDDNDCINVQCFLYQHRPWDGPGKAPKSNRKGNQNLNVSKVPRKTKSTPDNGVKKRRNSRVLGLGVSQPTPDAGNGVNHVENEETSPVVNPVADLTSPGASRNAEAASPVAGASHDAGRNLPVGALGYQPGLFAGAW